MPGRHVTDHQTRSFMRHRKTHSTEVAGADPVHPRVGGEHFSTYVTTHPFTMEIGVLCLLDHVGGPSCERDLDCDEWIVTHCSHGLQIA